jgi:hypothetical protein
MFSGELTGLRRPRVLPIGDFGPHPKVADRTPKWHSFTSNAET